MIVALDEEGVEADLAAGRLSCGCGGRLAPWSYARTRLVRQRGGPDVAVRPRRARCRACGRTTVVLPAHALPRRCDATEVIGAALHLAAEGHGHRRVAEALGRPPSTVRNWLRRARHLAEELYAIGVHTAHAYDPELAPVAARPTPIAGAVEALAVMARAVVRRLGLVGVSPWRLIAVLSGGLLARPAPSG